MSDITTSLVSDRPVRRNRRDVLRGLGVSAAGWLACAHSSIASAAVRGSGPRTFMAFLELDGALTPLSAVAGGSGTASVISEAREGLSPDKRAGAVQYEDIALRLPLAVPRLLLEWMNASLNQGLKGKNGAIVYVDATRKEWKRLEFYDAVISEVGFPSLEMPVRTSTPLFLRLSPAATQWVGGSARSVNSLGFENLPSSAQFRLVIPGLESATTNISKIEGLGAKRAAAGSGGALVRSKLPTNGALDVQNFKLYVPESQAVSFYNWFGSVAGAAGGKEPVAEKTGRLEWLSRDLATVVASADLSGLGIVRYAPDGFESGIESLGSVQIDLYCEQMQLTLPTT